jgi:DNA-binding PadR family transcriptional regulator
METSLGRNLSPLEFTVLGVLMKKGPCSGYAVLQEFTHSQSAYYRSGAGSIYPILKRLERTGLVCKEGKLLRLTAAGLSAFKEWFQAESPENEVTCSLDLIRSRMYFMKALAPEERLQFVDRLLAELAKLLQSCQASVQAYDVAGDPFSTLAMEGTVGETAARIRWLESVRAKLGQIP